MSRSVSYIGENVVFFDCGNYDEYDWDDMILNISSELKAKYPSLVKADRWSDRENHVFLENQHVAIACSEYCGIGSISVFTNEFSTGHLPTAEHWLEQCWSNIKKIISQYVDVLIKQGCFSNGECVYKRENGNRITDLCREEGLLDG